MRLQGKPGRVVQKIVRKPKREGMSSKRVVPLFKFDDKGFADVDTSRLSAHDVNRLKRLFKEVTGHKCKKCDFTTDNKGELMSHYRKKHPKGE